MPPTNLPLQMTVIGATMGAWGKEKYGLKPKKVEALEFLRWASAASASVCFASVFVVYLFGSAAVIYCCIGQCLLCICLAVQPSSTLSPAAAYMCTCSRCLGSGGVPGTRQQRPCHGTRTRTLATTCETPSCPHVRPQGPAD